MRDIAGLLVCVLLSSACRHETGVDQEGANQDPSKARRGREVRQRVVASVADAPVPTGLPLIVREGQDASGHPRSYVDRAGLRSLLHHQRFSELTAYIEQFQREFEADPKKDRYPTAAIEAFGSAEPELLPQLTAWVKASPSSFAPYAARAVHYNAVAWAQRGGEYASKTPKSNFDAMRATAQLIRTDVETAQKISPKLVEPDALLIEIAILTADRPLAQAALAHSLTICPSCFAVRALYMTVLEPRWGGSLEEMERFAEIQARAPYPDLKLLAGFADSERASIAYDKKDYGEALRYSNAACARGPHQGFLDQRAQIWGALKDYEKAEADADAALELSPVRPALRSTRAWIRDSRENWEGAAEDLIAGLRVDPTDEKARRLKPHVVEGLNYAGWQAHLKGDKATALRLLEL
ncbi:MAG TPA: DUF4034 domain-containing protein, partial [Polyangiaceae bacterium]|nr:DUF4034 domain-containing protein [Polyangiaceae bacterium]